MKLFLILLGSPLWIPLLLAALAVALALYMTLWALVISLWAVFVSLSACAVFGPIAGIGCVLPLGVPNGAALFGAGLFSAGVSILLFLGCRKATRGAMLVPKRLFAQMANRYY